MAWGNRNRKGARGDGGNGESDQFKGRKRKGRRSDGGITVDGRCSFCGGVEGRHNMIRRSQPIYDANRAPTGRYKIVMDRCPNA
jgi:hypothetical protein